MSEDNDNQQVQTGDPDALGDAGKKAIAAERKRADDAEKALKDSEARLQAFEQEGLSDLEKARKKIETLEATNSQLQSDVTNKSLEITRLNVGIDEGLDKRLISRLTGTDEESFKADAATLRELIPSDANQSPFPKADPSQGPKGNTGKQTTADQFADAIEAAFN